MGRHILHSESMRNANINIVFIDDASMLRLNERYLKHRFPTDVLSFSLADDHAAPEGEVYVNLDQAHRQAEDYRTDAREEIARLIVHGVLHLIGYRDGTASERRAMTDLENFYLRRF